MRIPARCNRCAVAGPTPPNRFTGSGSNTATSCPAGTTVNPSGLRNSEPIFAISFDVPTPLEPVTHPSPPRSAA
ncbi:hypothetical protein [Jidongwangia harbinensis]|uniref:hypothetical protein n=1 Tax=Jidongwangia harbinensis TaxID=2878561 RepID=UPI001CD9B743|nr:hypothetical protein [Jidongwangia harbinensis]MCA2219560.1 hypothetical protein [Jidongwangia harbinensis]